MVKYSGWLIKCEYIFVVKLYYDIEIRCMIIMWKNEMIFC